MRFVRTGSVALGILALSLAHGVLGCSRGPSAPGSATTTPTAGAAASAEVLPFIHDDFPKALAEAKRTNRPLFVDAWAPWCHSCQSLRTYVLTDPKLRPLASNFVWLSVDTEKDVNGGWVAKYPHEALPTLWVIDPSTEKAMLKWAGTVTADELRGLLSVAVANGGQRNAQINATMDTVAAFVRGNRALAAGDAAGAIEQHRAALAAAPKDHPQRPRIVEALVTELSAQKDPAACAEVAAAEAPGLGGGTGVTSRASVIVAGLDCARDAKKTAEEDTLLALGERDVADRDSAILPDDRSAVYEQLIESKKARKDAAGAAALAQAWAGFLDDATKQARTHEARAALDPWVLAAAIAVGDPARAIPALDRSERDFPSDYNPPARLGRAYLELGRLDAADRAADRAIARVYGPRAMRVYGLKADIAKARGDRGGEISALEAALARSEHAVLTQGQAQVRDGLAKRLAKLR
jgi:tetratricopeptide (TPR) repeat protein